MAMPDNGVDKTDLTQGMRAGERLLGRGLLADAQAHFEKLALEHPESPEVLNKLGVVAARQKRWDEARHFFERALMVDSEHVPAISNLGNIYREQGRLDDAIRAYQQAVIVDPDYATAHHNLGVVYKQKGMLSQAVSELKKGDRLQRGEVRRESSGMSPKALLWILVTAIVAFIVYIISR